MECTVKEHYTDEFGSWLEIAYSTESSPYESPSKIANAAIAAATTANARVRLHTMLLAMHPSQVIYCDTDSVVYEYDRSNTAHIDPTQVHGIHIGVGLGEWEHASLEVKGLHESPYNRIVEFRALGPKYYCYTVMHPDGTTHYCTKAKGIPRSSQNLAKLNQETYNEISETNKSQDCKHFTFKRKHGLAGELETQGLSRSIGVNIHKRHKVGPNGFTMPFGETPPVPPGWTGCVPELCI